MTGKVKNFVLPALASAVLMFLLAGLAHEIIFAQFFAENTDAEHEGTLIILAAYMLLAAIMVFAYKKVFTTDPGVWNSIVFGAVIGVLWVFPHGLAMAGAHGESISYQFVNAAWHMIEQGVGGFAIWFTIRKIKDRKSV
jgi:hypothetical protein